MTWHDHVRYFVTENASGSTTQLVKMLDIEFPSPEQRVRFFNEDTITRDLDIPGIRRSLGKTRIDGKHCLLLENVAGIPLKQAIEAGALDLRTKIKIGMRICAVLDALHGHNIAHRNLHGESILLDPKTHDITLTEFDNAGAYNLKRTHLGNPVTLEGRLAYIAPEQSGRMDRAVDHRCDLYSLGIVLFELFAEQLPFHSEIPLELVYQHIAIPAPKLYEQEKEIPEMLSRIVDRLLAKSPEDRYQSARATGTDLARALDLYQKTGTIPAFELSKDKYAGNLKIPEKLYGRAEEVRQLSEAFAEVSDGAANLMLVSGAPGIGKTALIREVQKPLTRLGGYFLPGKFDQLHSGLPYYGFVRIFRQLADILLTESEAQLAYWRSLIQEALGDLGGVLTQFVPALELIIGKQLPVPDLGSMEAQNRFNYLFQRLMHAICKPAHPIIIFLDDLQWADPASLNLLRVLLENPENAYLQVIGAYRDNEVGPEHPLQRLLYQVEGTITTYHLQLADLSTSEVNEMLADALYCSQEKCAELAEIVFQKTKGNPFFTRRFVESLYEEQLLRYVEPAANNSQAPLRAWQWDHAEIRQRDMTDNVVNLMTEKAKRLPVEMQQLLRIAAGLPSPFSLTRLAQTSGQLIREVAAALLPAIRAELIFPVGEGYNYIDPGAWETDTTIDLAYKFVHDRVQQAFYEMVPEGERKAMHLKIGRILLAHESSGDSGANVFEIANQLNVGTDLLTDDAERIAIAELNLRAALQATQSAAFNSARTYLMTGIQLLPEDAWHSHYDLALGLYSLAAEVTFSTYEYEDNASVVAVVRKHARNIGDKMRANRAYAYALKAQGKLKQTVEEGLKVLKELGEEFPAQPQTHHIVANAIRTQKAFKPFELQDLIDLPDMQDEVKRNAMEMFTAINSAAYSIGTPLFPLMVFRQNQLTLKYGNHPASSLSYTGYGTALSAFSQDYETAYEMGRTGTQVIDKYGTEGMRFSAHVHFVNNCFLRHWKEDLRNCIQGFEFVHLRGLQNGSLEPVGSSLTYSLYWKLMVGESLATLHEAAKRAHATIKPLRQDAAMNNCAMLVSAIADIREGSSYLKAGLEADAAVHVYAFEITPGDKTITCLNHWLQLTVAHILGDDAHGIRHVAEAHANIQGVFSMPFIPDLHFKEALLYLRAARKGLPGLPRKWKKTVKKTLKLFRNWSTLAPSNHAHAFALICAEQFRNRGKGKKAIAAYKKAIRLAQQHERPHITALAQELYGEFLSELGDFESAREQLRKSAQGYHNWGAEAKVRAMALRYPGIFASPATEQSPLQGTPTAAPKQSVDLHYVLKASGTFSEEIKLDSLRQKILRIMFEVAGAEFGALILDREGQLVVEIMGDARQEVLHTPGTPIASVRTLPQSILNYVSRTREAVVLQNAASDATYGKDPYIHARQSKSVLSKPILYQQELRGLLYLENNLAEGAFTRDHLQTLDLLSSQIAISLENAKLVETLEEKVEERTREIVSQRETIAATRLELEKEKAEKALQKALMEKEQAEASEQIKKQFFSRMTHEFRTPLTLILGPLQEIALQSREHRTVRHAEFALRNSKILLRLINQLLDLARMEAGYAQLRPARLDLVAFVAERVNSFRPLAQRKGLTLELNLGAEAMRVDFDPDMLEKVMNNLLSNAIKFTDNGGAVTVAVGSHPTESEQVRIAIKDTGLGIREDQLPFIFDRFYRVNTSKALAFEGTGLGLPLVKELVELHEGTVQVSSMEGIGTEVTLSIPREQSGQKRSTEATASPPSSLEMEVLQLENLSEADPETAENQDNVVLVVEDNQDVRDYVRMCLEPTYTVIEAVDGVAGIEKALQHIPDLIVSDVMMPRANGFEVCHRIKEDEKTSHIPIVMLTAKSAMSDKLEGLERGADAYLNKPFNSQELKAQIQNLIENRQRLRETLRKELLTAPDEIETDSLDEKFLHALKQIVTDHLADDQFSVEILSEKMAMSRTQLHRKLKALTDQNATEFIRNFRLEHARQLLRANAGTVSEIAFRVGYSSASYFSKSFSARYGMSPKEARKAVKGQG